MPGPWEKYAAPQSSDEASSGPWAKYQEPSESDDADAKEKARAERVAKEHSDYRAAHENDGVLEKLQDPKRWQAVFNNTGPYAQEVVAGTPPLVAPASALPKIASVASALANGEGIGAAIGRTALATGQGAVMSAMDGKEGESVQDKIDRVKGGAKLSGGIQIAAEALPVLGKIVSPAAKKIASAITGENENLIANYANRTDEVNNLIKESGGDMTAAADQVRSELSDGIQKAKAKINSQITNALTEADPTVRVSVDRILEKLEAAKEKLNPNFKADAISEIDNMIDAIKSQANYGRADGGVVDPKGLYEIKQFLNESSAGSYNKGGQIFSRANEASRAAKDAAVDAREAIKTYVPEISEADGQLSRLRQIEGRLNKNLLAPGKPDAALFTAGSGANPRNAANLKALEEISGVPVMQRATDLATAKSFARPSLLPSDATGKVMARMAAGAAVGGLIDGKEGAAIGGAAASPFALKYGINAMNVASKLANQFPSFGKLFRENPAAAQAVVQILNGQINRSNPGSKPNKEAEEYLRQNPQLLEKMPKNDRKPSAQLKGEAKWAQSGADNLGLSQEDAAAAMSDKRMRQLLIEASDLPKDSKRLKAIQSQISQGRWK